MSIFRTATLTVAVGAMLWLGRWARGDDERAPVPAAAEIAATEKLVAELFGSEYAKTSPASRAALAEKLITQAEQTKDDPVGRYVLFRDARDLAAKGGEALTAGKAADALAAEYRLGAGAARVPMAAPLAAAVMTPDKARVAAEVLLSAADAASAGDDWDEAIALLKAAEITARKAKNFPLTNKAKTQLAQAENSKAAAAKVQEQVAALKANPNDPAANLAVGRYLCLVKRDWNAALPLLAKGATGSLKEAVNKDRKAANADGDDADRLAAADAWYELAGHSSADGKAPLQARAALVPTGAPGAAGLTRAKIEKRLAELQTMADGMTEKTRLWTFVRKAVNDQKLDAALIGGAFAHNTFEEIPKDGGILIGFRYTTKTNGRYPGVVTADFPHRRWRGLGQRLWERGGGRAPGCQGQAGLRRSAPVHPWRRRLRRLPADLHAHQGQRLGYQRPL